MSHAATAAHQNALLVIAYLTAHGGSSPLTNGDIAKAMGWSRRTYVRAAQHAKSCPDLPALVSYRGNQPGAPVVIFDSTATAVLAALTDRSLPSWVGLDRMQRVARTARKRMVAIVETAAREAYSSGQSDLADALGFAADDLRTHGEVQPATMALLRTLKAA